jgi:hypothetical protein
MPSQCLPETYFGSQALLKSQNCRIHDVINTCFSFTNIIFMKVAENKFKKFQSEYRVIRISFAYSTPINKHLLSTTSIQVNFTVNILLFMLHAFVFT